ncbi:MAG TPA: hypothetical protein VIH73_01930 [Acidimicrobiales bacterium]
MGRSVIDLALRCYPKWWTDRYGEEMRAVIDDLEHEGRSSSSIALGLLRDALRSRLLARGMPRTYGMLANRTKTSVAAGTIPWLAIVPFVLLITGRYTLRPHSNELITGYPFALTPFRTKALEAGHTVFPAISSSSWVIGISVMLVEALFLLTLIVLAIGLAAFRYGIKREKGRNRRWMYWTTWAPAYTVLGILTLKSAQSAFDMHWRPQDSLVNGKLVVTVVGGHPALAALMGDLTWTVAIGGWLFSMIALVLVANRANVPPDTLRFGRTVCVLTSISLSLTFVALLVWGVAIDVQNGQSHVGNAIVASYPLHDLWLPMVLVLGLTCAVSIWGASTARRSWQTIRTHRLWDT